MNVSNKGVERARALVSKAESDMRGCKDGPSIMEPLSYGMFYTAMQSILDALDEPGPKPAEIPKGTAVPWHEIPECRDFVATVSSMGQHTRTVLAVAGDNLMVVREDGYVYVTSRTCYRVVRKANIRAGDFVEVRSTGERGVVTRDEQNMRGPLLLSGTTIGYCRAELILLCRGREHSAEG